MAKDEQNGGLKWTRHPVVDGWLPPLAETEIRQWLKRPDGETQVLQYWTEHERLVRESVEDPLNHGFELPYWQDIWAMIERKAQTYLLGGNGTGKTEIGGKAAVRQLLAGPNKKVLCVSQGDGVSKGLQQPAVYKYLPRALREANEGGGAKKRSAFNKLTWSLAGGFTEGTFVLPNRSQCWFKTVEQYIRDKNSFEGPEYDFVWIDEPVPKDLLDTLKFRAAKAGGKLLVTFTAIHGFDATCAEVLTGARLVKSLPMNWAWKMEGAGGGARGAGADGAPDERLVVPGLRADETLVKDVAEIPKGHMPYIMQPLDPRQGVIFCWSQWNVFLKRGRTDTHAPAVFEECALKPKRVVKMRLFGWAEKLSGCQFPMFDVNVHASEAVGATIDTLLRERALTSYMSGDPQSARSYLLLWGGVDRRGRKFVFDESPRFDEGEWVTSDGRKGDGQTVYAGMGTNWYKNYIRQREREHGCVAVRRFGDPRAFATEGHSADGGMSLFDLFRQNGATRTGVLPGRGEEREEEEPGIYGPMNWEPAKVKRSLLQEAASGSLDMINTAFGYDRDKPISAENEPRLYIHPRCLNLIRAILNWDPIQGGDSPWKDPIDALRYLFGEELYWVDPEVPEIVAGRGF